MRDPKFIAYTWATNAGTAAATNATAIVAAIANVFRIRIYVFQLSKENG